MNSYEVDAKLIADLSSISCKFWMKNKLAINEEQINNKSLSFILFISSTLDVLWESFDPIEPEKFKDLDDVLSEFALLIQNQSESDVGNSGMISEPIQTMKKTEQSFRLQVMILQNKDDGIIKQYLGVFISPPKISVFIRV